MKVSEKEVEAIMKLDSFKRYQYCIKRIADSEKIYTIIDNEEIYGLAEVVDKRLFSVWPSVEFAQLACKDEWQRFQPLEISLENFHNNIIDEIDKNNWLINVLPIQNKTGFVVGTDEFLRDLTDELEKY